MWGTGVGSQRGVRNDTWPLVARQLRTLPVHPHSAPGAADCLPMAPSCLLPQFPPRVPCCARRGSGLVALRSHAPTHPRWALATSKYTWLSNPPAIHSMQTPDQPPRRRKQAPAPATPADACMHACKQAPTFPLIPGHAVGQLHLAWAHHLHELTAEWVQLIRGLVPLRPPTGSFTA